MSSTSSAVLRADKIWLDGKLIKWDEGQVHLMTHALHYGLGVFEGIRAYKTKDGRLAVFRLQDHIRRLFDSAHICMLKLPYTEEAFAEACLELLRAQKDRFAETGAYLRPIAFMGDGAMGLGAVNPTRMAITAWDWGAYLGEKGMREGIRAKVSSFTRMHVNVNMVRGKITGQYINSILAKREAVLGGYDEAILLDISGFVAEASGRFEPRRSPLPSSPASPGIRSSESYGTAGARYPRSPSPATRCTSPMRSSSRGRRRRSPPSARWTTGKSERANPETSPNSCKKRTSRPCAATIPSTPSG